MGPQRAAIGAKAPNRELRTKRRQSAWVKTSETCFIFQAAAAELRREVCGGPKRRADAVMARCASLSTRAIVIVSTMARIFIRESPNRGWRYASSAGGGSAKPWDVWSEWALATIPSLSPPPPPPPPALSLLIEDRDEEANCRCCGGSRPLITKLCAVRQARSLRRLAYPRFLDTPSIAA